MNVSLSLCLIFTLMMSSYQGKEESHEEESTTDYYDYATETATPDYDYNATFDYSFETGPYLPVNRNQAAAIGPLSLVLLLGLAVSETWN